MTIHLENETDIQIDFNYEELIRHVIETCLDYENCPYEVEISVLLTNNLEIQQINKEFRQKDVPTDVLSFPALVYNVPGEFSNIELEQSDTFNPETGELILGDIVLSIEKAMAQAEEYGHSLKREIAFLIAHSMFHLMGYDHMEEDERIIMEEKQSFILQELNILR